MKLALEVGLQLKLGSVWVRVRGRVTVEVRVRGRVTVEVRVGLGLVLSWLEVGLQLKLGSVQG